MRKAPDWVTCTVTASAFVITPARVSSNTALAPSVTEPVSAAIVTAGRSSSVMVRVTSSGGRTTVAPTDTVPDTVTCLFSVSSVSSSAVTVTDPVLSVAPAANVSTGLSLNLKSPASAGNTAAADTVTVNSALWAFCSLAVTFACASFSPSVVVSSASSTVTGVSTSVTLGSPSSSVMVSVWLSGAIATPGFDTAPDTVTILSPSSVELSSAVMVTDPVLTVALASNVNTRSALNV